jgi:aminoglycoside phosphotransferase (APT) family kinase protein
MRPETCLKLSRAQLATVPHRSLGSLGNPGCNDEFMANDRSAVSSADSSETRDFTSESTWRTLRVACETVGLNSAGARLLRLGSNANFRLESAPVLVRIARDHLDTVRKEVDVARWLATQGFPAARLMEDVDQLLVLDGTAVTFWQLIDQGTEPAHAVDAAGILRDLHRLPSPDTFELPRFDPLPNIAQRLDTTSEGATAEEMQYLRRRCDELRERFAKLTFVLPEGVIHADAHVGNLLRDRSGAIRLIDFEAFAWGPREWDLAVLATQYKPFNWMPRAEYRACVAAYGGFDVISWDGYDVLVAIRELNMTTWLLQNVSESPDHAEEFRTRMADLRDAQAPRHWRQF